MSKKLYLYFKNFFLLKNDFIFYFLKDYIFFISYKEVLLQLLKNRSVFDSFIFLYYSKLFILNRFFFYFNRFFSLLISTSNFSIFKSNLNSILDFNFLYLNDIKKQFFFYFYYNYKYFLNIINVPAFYLVFNNFFHSFFFILYLKKLYIFKKKLINNLFFFLSCSFFFSIHDKYYIIYDIVNSYNVNYLSISNQSYLNYITKMFDVYYFIQFNMNENKNYIFFLDFYFFYFFFLKKFNKYKFTYYLSILFFFWKESSFNCFFFRYLEL